MTVTLFFRVLTWIMLCLGMIPLSHAESSMPFLGKPLDSLGTPVTGNQHRNIFLPTKRNPLAPWLLSPFLPPRGSNRRSQENSLIGKITQVSAVAEGLKITIDNKKPLVPCQEKLLIPEPNQTILKVALAAFWRGQTITILVNSNCVVKQLDLPNQFQSQLFSSQTQEFNQQSGNLPAGMLKKRGPFGDMLVPK